MAKHVKMHMDQLFSELHKRVNDSIPIENGNPQYEFRTTAGACSSPFNFHAVMHYNSFTRKIELDAEQHRILNIVSDLNCENSYEDTNEELQNFLDMYSLEPNFERVPFDNLSNDAILYFSLGEPNALDIDEIVKMGLLPSVAHVLIAIKKGLLRPYTRIYDKVKFAYADVLILTERLHGDLWK